MNQISYFRSNNSFSLTRGSEYQKHKRLDSMKLRSDSDLDSTETAFVNRTFAEAQRSEIKLIAPKALLKKAEDKFAALTLVKDSIVQIKAFIKDPVGSSASKEITIGGKKFADAATLNPEYKLLIIQLNKALAGKGLAASFRIPAPITNSAELRGQTYTIGNDLAAGNTFSTAMSDGDFNSAKLQFIDTAVSDLMGDATSKEIVILDGHLDALSTFCDGLLNRLNDTIIAKSTTFRLGLDLEQNNLEQSTAAVSETFQDIDYDFLAGEIAKATHASTVELDKMVTELQAADRRSRILQRLFGG